MFTDENGTTIDNKDKKEFEKKMLKLIQFCNF